MPTIIHPGLDTSQYSDEELNTKISELRSRMNYAHNSWQNSQMISQLQAIQDSLIFEQRERSAKEFAAYQAATQKQIIETDPEFVEKDPKKEVQQVSRKEDSRKKRQIPIITKNWITKKT